MVSLKKWPWIVFGSVLSMVLWTFISVNTSIFTDSDGFNYFLYITSYILVIGIWGLTIVDLKISDKLYKAISVLMFALTPFFCMQIAMVLSGAAEYSFKIYFINILFYLAVMAIILAVTRSMRYSAIIATILAYIFNMASFVVNILRGTPLIPSDFLAIGTAANVAENYNFQMRYPIIAATVIAVVVIALIAKFSFTPKFRFKNTVFAVSGAAYAVIFVLCLASIDYSDYGTDVFDQYHANNMDGTLYSFYINVRKMILSKPDGYYEEDAAQLLAAAQPDQAEQTELIAEEDTPNIIVIMNESFSDLSVVGNFDTSEDYMPFINSMTKNTVKGQLLVSPFGGYTCNTEFEFLTGLSMGLLPSGSTPYLQYFSKAYDFALPSYLSNLGYETLAIHPYLASGWNRTKVYDLMGFDDFISIENLDELVDESEWEYIRNYISDRTSYKAVINSLEDKDDDDKMFIFNVTMQNHGGYTYGGGEFPTVTVTDMQGHYKETEQYLSLIKESDEAFEELITYLKKYDEPTVVVMFGDHQPAIEQQFYEELYGQSISNLTSEEVQKRYKVPFVIWANYDIESRSDVKTSPNYLSDLLLDTINMPKNELGNFTSQISESIPQINAMGHYDSNGIWYTNDTETDEELKNYEFVEYYMMTKKER
ncbi:MAG: LTA synthase family protein [Oscillospiraceae bacterium]|nr:LTA synthase family protein [Oscillospiraceae bacterium]